MPSGNEKKRVYIQPFSETEFHNLVTEKNEVTLFIVLLTWLLKLFQNKHNLSEAELINLTGRVPREMALLEFAKNKESFIVRRGDEFRRRITNAFKQMSNVEKHAFLANLDALFGLQVYGAHIRFIGSAVDTGLLYKDESDLHYHCLSNIASEELINFLLQEVRLKRVMSKVCYSNTTINNFARKVLRVDIYLKDG